MIKTAQRQVLNLKLQGITLAGALTKSDINITTLTGNAGAYEKKPYNKIQDIIISSQLMETILQFFKEIVKHYNIISSRNALRKDNEDQDVG